MKKRKFNRLKGYDYSKDNLYFITNCVRNNVCCLGRVIRVGTGRGLSLLDAGNHHSENNAGNHHSEIDDVKINHPESSSLEPTYQMELNQYGSIVEERINWLTEQYPYVVIQNYVVMPNHFHLIIEIDSEKVKDQNVKIKSVSSLIGAMKTTSSSLIRKGGFGDFEWHRSFHDHIIRNENAYHRISNYIDMNPKKWFEDRFYAAD